MMTTVSDKKNAERQNWSFCWNNHLSELCNRFYVEKKKQILKSQGRCFLCLKKFHPESSIVSKIFCACTGRHNQTICKQSNSGNNKNYSEENLEALNAKNGSSNEITSSISGIGKSKNFSRPPMQKLKTKIVTLSYDYYWIPVQWEPS